MNRAPRQPSAYNLFMKTEVARIKQENAGLSHKEAFKEAARNWGSADANPQKRPREDGLLGGPDEEDLGKDDGEEGEEDAEHNGVDQEGEEPLEPKQKADASDAVDMGSAIDMGGAGSVDTGAVDAINAPEVDGEGEEGEERQEDEEGYEGEEESYEEEEQKIGITNGIANGSTLEEAA